jgi:hypothetical protein
LILQSLPNKLRNSNQQKPPWKVYWWVRDHCPDKQNRNEVKIYLENIEDVREHSVWTVYLKKQEVATHNRD